MEISDALSTDLDLLTDALNEPAVDLADTLQKLAVDATAAVPSFLGLSLTVTSERAPVVFTALDDRSVHLVTASLFLPLPGAGTAGRTVSLVLYASVPGAYVDLAADLSWLTGIGVFALDQHLDPPRNADGLKTLHDESLVNQAIGALVARGLTPEAAEERLARLARDAGTDRYVVAADVLRQSSDHGVDEAER